MARKKPVRRKKAAAGSVGLTPAETARIDPATEALAAAVAADGGAVLGRYNDPFGGKPLLLVALPVAMRRADAVPARPVRRARQTADGRDRQDRPLPRSDHRRFGTTIATGRRTATIACRR